MKLKAFNIFDNHFAFINMFLDLHTKMDIPLTWSSPVPQKLTSYHTYITLPNIISDHSDSDLHFKISIVKPSWIGEEISYRQIQCIDRNKLMEDIHESSLNISPAQRLLDHVHQYNKVLGELIDKHAPLK